MTQLDSSAPTVWYVRNDSPCPPPPHTHSVRWEWPTLTSIVFGICRMTHIVPIHCVWQVGSDSTWTPHCLWYVGNDSDWQPSLCVVHGKYFSPSIKPSVIMCRMSVWNDLPCTKPYESNHSLKYMSHLAMNPLSLRGVWVGNDSPSTKPSVTVLYVEL